jgi:chloramphenicol 3-O-phosphotransferase
LTEVKSLRYQDIFVPGGFPRHTYNPRVELQLEQRLSEVNDNLCKLVTVTGQTKSGKTVLARKILPLEDSIWIDGGIVSQEDDFWHVIIDQLQLFQSAEKEESGGTTSKRGFKGTVEANIFVAKGSGEIGTELQKAHGAKVSGGRTVSSRVVALSGLRDSNNPLVVDDFHYIPRDMQGSIVRALKPLIFNGLPVVIIAIPHRRYDALKVEKEMTGRISPIEIPIWSDAELQFISDTGFGLR